MSRRLILPEDNIRSKTRQDGDCVVWILDPGEQMPTQIKHKGKGISIRHFIYEAYYGAPDRKRYAVKMTCGNPICCKPEHMIMDTFNRERTPQDQLFWKYVVKPDSEDECWGWSGSVEKGGYPVMYVRGSGTRRATRYSYTLHHGEIQPDLLVCHKCNNPICCNPKHLYAGTLLDNARDKIEAGHQFRGVDSPRAKLTEEQVRSILRAESSIAALKLGRSFGVTSANVHAIRKGRTWRHIQ